jgi:hypothetical protein
MFEEGDVVKLVVPTLVEWDDEQVELLAGMFGTIVAESKTGSSQLVEFCDNHGVTIAMVAIDSASLELHRKGVSAARFDSQKNIGSPKIA